MPKGLNQHVIKEGDESQSREHDYIKSSPVTTNVGGQNTAPCTLNKNAMLRFGTTHVIGPRVSLFQPFNGKLNGFTVMYPSISLIQTVRRNMFGLLWGHVVLSASST